MLTKDFCEYLEYHLLTPLVKSDDINLRRCWCDGVLIPDNENMYSLNTVVNTRKIITQAWVDEGTAESKGKGRGKIARPALV